MPASARCCAGATGFTFFGAVRLDELPPEGNVLVFSDKARQVRVESVNVNDWPIFPGR